MDTAVGKQLSFVWKSVRRRVYQEEGARNKEPGRVEAGPWPYSCERVRTPAIFIRRAAREGGFPFAGGQESCGYTSTVAQRGTSTSAPRASSRPPSTAARPAAAVLGG